MPHFTNRTSGQAPAAQTTQGQTRNNAPSEALVKAFIKPREGSAGTCTAMFNPKELSMSRQAEWSPKSPDMDDPDLEHVPSSQSSTLSVTLFFDTYEQRTDCYALIKPLEQMIRMDPALKRPPLCMFVWGRFVFQGVIDSLTQKYTMFLPSGMMVRCEVGLTMRSALMCWPDPNPKWDQLQRDASKSDPQAQKRLADAVEARLDEAVCMRKHYYYAKSNGE